MTMPTSNSSFLNLPNLAKLKLEEDLLEHGIQPYFVFNDTIVWNVPRDLKIVDAKKDKLINFTTYKVIRNGLESPRSGEYLVSLREVLPVSHGSTNIHRDTSLKNKNLQTFYMNARDFCDKICNAPINDSIRDNFARVGKRNELTLSLSQQLKITKENIYSLLKEMNTVFRDVFQINPDDYDEKSKDKAYSLYSDGYTVDYIRTTVLDNQKVNKAVFLQQIEKRYENAGYITLPDEILIEIVGGNSNDKSQGTLQKPRPVEQPTPKNTLTPEINKILNQEISLDDLNGIDLSDW